MSVGLLIITHDRIGEQLLRCAISTLGGRCPLHVAFLPVTNHCNPEELCRQAQKQLESVDSGDGVLVLTDMYGSTPSNIATSLTPNPSVSVLAGLNLPMLIKIFNYPKGNLEAMTRQAIRAGQESILCCDLADSQFCEEAVEQARQDNRAA